MRQNTGIAQPSLFRRLFDLFYRRERKVGSGGTGLYSHGLYSYGLYSYRRERKVGSGGTGLRRTFRVGVGHLLEGIELFCVSSVSALVDFYTDGWAAYVLGVPIEQNQRMLRDKVTRFEISLWM